MTVRFRVFKSGWKRWEELFGEAAAYATEVGPDRLIGVSHSQEGPEGVVTVWYWDTDPPGPTATPGAAGDRAATKGYSNPT